MHYLALNNGWKGERGQAVPFDPARHVEERRVVDGLRPRLPPDDSPDAAPSDTAPYGDRPGIRPDPSAVR